MSAAKKQPRILSNRYKLLKKIGRGAFGTVYLVEDLRSSERYKVLKEIQIGELDPDETVEAIHEAKLLGKLSHSAILKFYNCFVALPSFCMVTEYCEEGDLDQCINRLKEGGLQLPVSTTVRWLIQILLGVEYLHGRRILHRDLKTKNIFLKAGMVKIGDFGISRVLMSSCDMASTFLGTPYFMSPELLQHQGYNAKSDIWSVGCVLYEMCAQEHAYKGPGLMGILCSICDDPCPTLPASYPPELQSVLARMLEKQPQLRASARELLRIPYLRERTRQISDGAAAAASSASEFNGGQLLREETAEAEGGASLLEALRPRRAAPVGAPKEEVAAADAEESDDLVPAAVGDSWRRRVADGGRRANAAWEAAMTSAELADTYYSPDFTDDDDDEEEEDDGKNNDGTAKASASAGDIGDGDGDSSASSTSTTLRFARELEAALARSGRLALDDFEDAADAATVGRFGRDGLDQTLRELRRRCQRLGATFDFDAVYRYLKANAGLSASQKALGLSRLTSDAEAAGLVEQLVFLEACQ